jgi:hypothetical protein
MSETQPTPPTVPPKATRPRSRGWLVYFVLVFGVAIAAAVTLGVINRLQQLTPEELAASRALWEKRKPADYDMVYVQRINDAKTWDAYTVQVRGGKVVSVKLNHLELSERQRHYHSMDALFDHIERFLEIDYKPGAPSTYLRGSFDPENGHLREFVRRVMNSTTRVQLRVEEFNVLTPEGARP